jgi:ABC-type phosphate transport system substrate-binding protein
MRRSAATAASLLIIAGAADGAIHQRCAVTDAVTGDFVGRVAAPTATCACGASLPHALYQRAAFAYSTYGQVTYTATGSTTGKQSAEYGTVDFAGSDSMLADSQYARSPDLQVPASRRPEIPHNPASTTARRAFASQMYPAVAAAVVPVYFLPQLDALNLPLVLDRVVLPKIFLGDIWRWNDSAILALQSAATRNVLLGLPDSTIRVVVRDDGSGTTEIFTRALSLFSQRTGGNQTLGFATRLGGADVIDWCEDGMEALSCPTTAAGTDNVNPSDDNGTYYTCAPTGLQHFCLLAALP